MKKCFKLVIVRLSKFQKSNSDQNSLDFLSHLFYYKLYKVDHKVYTIIIYT